MTLLRKPFLLLGAILAAIACSDSPTGPTESPDGQITPEETVLVRFDSVAPAQSLYFTPEADVAYAVEVTPIDVGATVVVTDSVSGAPLLSRDESIVPATPVERRTTPVFTVSPGEVVRVTLYSYTYPVQPGKVEVTVRTTTPGPEQGATATTIGATVTGEGLGDALDIDEFTFSATAGQLVVPALTLPGAADPTRLACLRIIAPNGAPLGGTVASPGDSLADIWPHSRIALPFTGTYRARVGNGWNGCTFPRPLFYTGPYTFTIHLIDPGPEVEGATVALGDTVTGESIGAIGDIDRFTIVGAPGALVEVLTRRVAGGSGTLQFTAGALGAKLLVPSDSLYGARPTGRLILPDSGKLSVEFRGFFDGPKGDTGAYTFIAFPIDTAPESRAAAFALGDTLAGEAIDPNGDIDRFTFTATAGQYAAFDFRTDLGPFASPLRAEVRGPGDSLLGVTGHPNGFDSTLASTGRLYLPVTGAYAVRVRGEFNGQGPKHVGYWVGPRAIDAGPETASDSFTLGDSVTVEGLDGTWDVDTYPFSVTDSGIATRLTLRLDGAAIGTGTAFAYLVNVATGATVAAVTAYPGGVSTSGLVGLPIGDYLLRIQDGGTFAEHMTGAYRVGLSRIDFAPEVASDTLVLGDTLDTEVLGPGEDIDRFVIPLTKGQSVLVSFTGTGTPGGSLGVSFTPESGAQAITVASSTSGGALGSHTSARIDAATTGIYVLEVRGDPAPYVLAIVGLPTTPESAVDSLAIGDSLTGESIGAPGDLDRYTVTGAPGDLAVLRFTATLTTGSIQLVVRDPIGDSTLVALSNPGDTQRSNRFRFPPGGQLEMTVAEPPSFWQRGCTNEDCNDFYQATGAYSFAVIPIDPAPESVSATLVRGDTLSDEAIDPIGDFDVFTYTGTAGEWFQFEVHTRPGVPNSVIYSIQLVDMTDSTVVTDFGMFADKNALIGVTLPHAGTYELRVSGYEQFKSFGQYTLVIR